MKLQQICFFTASLIISVSTNANCVSDNQPDNADSLIYLSNLTQQIISLKKDNSTANYNQLQLMSLSTFHYIKDTTVKKVEHCDISIDEKSSIYSLYQMKEKSFNKTKECQQLVEVLTIPLLIHSFAKQYNNALIDEMLALVKK